MTGQFIENPGLRTQEAGRLGHEGMIHIEITVAPETRRHDGEYQWIFDRGVPRWSDDGEFGGYIGSCIDVTPRVEAEAELERVRQMLPFCAWCGKVRDGEGYYLRLRGESDDLMVFEEIA